jgi:hypothetical protein
MSGAQTGALKRTDRAVIPAKAGTQGPWHLVGQAWVPAFVGMTFWRDPSPYPPPARGGGI